MNLAASTSWGLASVRRARSRSLPGLRDGPGSSLLESRSSLTARNRRPFRADALRGCACMRSSTRSFTIRDERGRDFEAPFDSLDFLYVPSPDVVADLAFYRDVLGGEVVFAI